MVPAGMKRQARKSAPATTFATTPLSMNLSMNALWRGKGLCCSNPSLALKLKHLEKTFNALALLAVMTPYIPNQGEQMVGTIIPIVTLPRGIVKRKIPMV